MNGTKPLVSLLGLVLLGALALMGCEGDAGPAGPPGSVANITCGDCHNDTNIISGKQIQWSESAHGMGEAYVRGGSRSCVGCHSGNGFADMIAAGLNPGSTTEGDPDPTRQDCRACHMIHEGYTLADFAVRTTAAVDFYAEMGTTYDGGTGNLCATCHQPRRIIAAAVNDTIPITSEHWGPHHSGQASMLMGVTGAGSTVGTPGTHYSGITNTCVDCHMGDGANHTMEPDTDDCMPCHDVDDYDVGGTQSEVQADLDRLGDELVARGILTENTEDGHPTQAVLDAGGTTSAQAIALWNWLFIAHEDGSLGVHNPAYTRALIDESLTLVGLTP